MKHSKRIYPWTPKEITRIKALKTPEKIQQFLDQALYNTGKKTLTPGEVLKFRRAHCFDGAIFAASVLGFHGYSPLILDLRAVRDDDHVLALFKRDGRFGAVAKSNYVGLRYREPIYKNVRELALSYFESYFNLQREKSLREYSLPFDLSKVLGIHWERSEETFNLIAEQLDRSKHHTILRPSDVRQLALVDMRTFRAGKVGRRL